MQMQFISLCWKQILVMFAYANAVFMEATILSNFSQSNQLYGVDAMISQRR